MHQVEYVLRDFNNSVKCLNNNGYILLDDILPINESEQNKMPEKYIYKDKILKSNCFWTGDVWKFLFYLISNYSDYITLNIYRSKYYRGVVKIQLKNRIQIPNDVLDEINSYTYKSDFITYVKQLTLYNYFCKNKDRLFILNDNLHKNINNHSRKCPLNLDMEIKTDYKTMKLGAVYNVFNSEELLEASIKSIKNQVDFVVIVFQTISNFGEKCSEDLIPTLNNLQNKGLVDVLIEYTPKPFNEEEMNKLLSKNKRNKGVKIADQYLNEIMKREVGRLACYKYGGCNYFMAMDCDEFYKDSDLKNMKTYVFDNNIDCLCCKMRNFFKWPTIELLPETEAYCVPVIYRIHQDYPFKIDAPYPCTVDPTRKLENISNIKIAHRDMIEMYHYSYVRKDIKSKLFNISNRFDLIDGGQSNSLENYVKHFEKWEPSNNIIHPHPYFQKSFTEIKQVPNWFDIDITNLGLKQHTDF